LTINGYNILYLPRYDHDRSYVKKQDNIFIPNIPLSGLDVCYYSEAVLTGAGTFAREAALMGVPAVSFYAGSDFLSVDKKLISQNKVFFSRIPDQIIDYLSGDHKKQPDFTRSVAVQNEVFGIIDRIVQY